MKKFFNFSKAIVILTVLFTAITAYANDKTTAVLQHGDTPQAFYGADAFKEAMEAAQHGDHISLSSGVFNQTTINKAVKIQGAGVSTRINGEINASLPDSLPGLEISGIKFMHKFTILKVLTDAKFKRCTFMGEFKAAKTCVNNIFIQCKFLYQCNLNDSRYDTHKMESIIFNNCISTSHIGGLLETDDVTFNNCTLHSLWDMRSVNINNSIIYDNTSDWPAVKYINVIIASDVSNRPNVDAIQENVISLTRAEIKALFKDLENYELTDEAAAKYLGSDGKQLGAYGGAFPFTLTPAIPEITSVKIDPLVKEDGKLSISISAKTNN